MIHPRNLLAVLLLCGALAASQETKIDYSKPRNYFPDPVGPYIGRTVPAPSLTNSTRLTDLIKDGKLMLSLDDAIALALENNLDLAISRYNLQIADTDILRTKSGASARGVASGLVQGTPGGGIGGFGTGAPGAGAGGTSGGAGGAGTGASGLVESTIGTGAAVESFDPAINGNLSIEHAAVPLSNTVTTGTAQLQQNTATANFLYTQAFTSGTSLSFGFNNSRQTSSSLFTSLTPLLSSAAQVQLRQRLLSGFGFGPNRRFIVIAKNNKVIADAGFRNQVIATVTQIQNIYWDLVNAYEDARVKERSLSLAQRTLEDNRKQVQLQSMAPIEVLRAEAEVEARNQELITAQSNFELQQLLMKNAISRTLAESTLADTPVLPTDTMSLPENEPVRPVQDLIGEAVDKRPEMHQAIIDLKNREVTKKSARNALLPTMDLVGFYGGSGIAGVQNPASLAAGDPAIATTGYPDVLQRTFNNSSPDYAIGVNLNIPLRNRAAQADQVRSELEYRQAQLRIQQLKNQIVIEVRNALFSVKQNRARVAAAQKARDLAQKSFDIEQKKLALGASTSAQVLVAGRDLAVAESNLVAASTIYEKSRVELDRSVGATLERLNIDIRDAEVGELHQMPRATDVLPSKPQ
jgi:outer membrane protein TolC